MLTRATGGRRRDVPETRLMPTMSGEESQILGALMKRLTKRFKKKKKNEAIDILNKATGGGFSEGTQYAPK
jgi:hypothetical protein